MINDSCSHSEGHLSLLKRCCNDTKQVMCIWKWKHLLVYSSVAAVQMLVDQCDIILQYADI